MFEVRQCAMFVALVARVVMFVALVARVFKCELFELELEQRTSNLETLESSTRDLYTVAILQL